ncbi:restriction endonuclease subunit S [Chitinophaga varians]|uniref:restriction endonuclease subunit S n=1 Tax=Chitinophaga varians TaxID=2202339 RepID=UPI00165ED707|nr:restriction endonuclease subunit S [Chitinophaga varians]MBC9911684.1 restriction endonuclease subunit S [Chitinophaga varians]
MTDWKLIKLEEALDYVIGGDWGKDPDYDDPGYSFAYCIRATEIKNWETEKGKTASLRKIKKANIEKRKLVSGDILVEISGGGPEQPVGRSILIDQSVLNFEAQIPKISTNFLRLLRPKSDVDSKFLNFFLRYFYHSADITKYQNGSNNLRNLRFNDYLNINFPCPSISTQQAIVSKIEELFSEVDKGVESLRTAQQQLKTYRQSVLKWAFEGRLTNEIVKEGELPEGWTWKSIDEVAKIKGGKRLPPKHQYSEEPTDYVYIMAGNLKYGTVTNKPTYINEETYKALTRYKVTGGEVYITIVGACIGDAGIIPDNIGNSILTENAAKIIDLINVNNKYLAYWINSAVCQSNIKSKILSATLGKLALNRIGMLEVPVPPIVEQQKIVQEIESRLSLTDKLEEMINQSLQQAEALKQSILKKAFEGKLI